MKYIIQIFLITICFTANGQTPNFKITNYTVDDGLPSNECHGIVQDSLGYIWIATDRGLVKWDGYEFEVWGTDKGLEDMSCIDLYKDKDENIWINTVASGLYFLENGQEKIKPYEFNKTIFSHIILDRFVEKIAFDEENNLIVHSSVPGTFKFTETGDVISIGPTNENTYIDIYRIENEPYLTLKNSYHRILNEGGDFAAAKFNLNGNLISQCKAKEYRGNYLSLIHI